MRWVAGVLLLLAGSGAQAAQVEALAIEYHDGIFSARGEFVIDAPLAAVHAALTDFEHLGRLTPAILESKVVERRATGTLVFTR